MKGKWCDMDFLDRLLANEFFDKKVEAKDQVKYLKMVYVDNMVLRITVYLEEDFIRVIVGRRLSDERWQEKKIKFKYKKDLEEYIINMTVMYESYRDRVDALEKYIYKD